jgi:hypothetical protein
VSTNLLGGQLIWGKPAVAASRYYPAGFTNWTEVAGSRYQRRPAGTPVIPLANGSGQLIFSGDFLSAPFTNVIFLSGNNRVVSSQPGLSMTVSPLSGWFYGTTVNPETGKGLPFQGMLLQEGNFGAGFNWTPTYGGWCCCHRPSGPRRWWRGLIVSFGLAAREAARRLCRRVSSVSRRVAGHCRAAGMPAWTVAGSARTRGGPGSGRTVGSVVEISLLRCPMRRVRNSNLVPVWHGVLRLGLVVLMALVALAVRAQPANDNFADAEELTGIWGQALNDNADALLKAASQPCVFRPVFHLVQMDRAMDGKSRSTAGTARLPGFRGHSPAV